MGSVSGMSEQFVIVGDESVGDRDGIGGETLIEPFLFDAASVSTHYSQVGAIFDMVGAGASTNASSSVARNGSHPFP